MLTKSKKIAIASVCLAACLTTAFAAKPKTKFKAVDPELAVNELAAVTRTAAKPGEGVYYSMFVRSFADSNKDGIGDFNGIIKKLDYLNDGDDLTTTDLGITGIWMLPIFPSQSYHGYDVDNYYDVNPEYGTMKDFENLLAECKKRGISVIIDMTCNHSSAYNDWFIQSKKADSPYRTWYRWINDLDFAENGGPYNRNQKGLAGNIWTIDMSSPVLDANGKPVLDKSGLAVMNYYAGLFSTQMPDLNMDESAVREEFKKVFKFWLDKGVSGFRFDAAGHVYNSAEVKPGSETMPKAIAFWKEMNDYIKSVNPDAYCVAEVWDPTAVRAKYLGGMQSNFHFDLGTLITQIINNQEMNDKANTPDDPDTSTYNGFARSLESTYSLYASNNPDYIDAPFLSNHDQPRSCAGLRNKPEKMKLAANMYILAEGIPFIYYGEEIGMKSGKDDPSKRTPLVWKAAGKEKLTPTWIDSGAYGNAAIYNKKTVPVDVQEKDPASVLQHYKRVIRVKTAHPALYRGRLKAVPTDSAVVESYVMECDVEKAFVAHNVSSSRTVKVKIPEGCDMPLVFASNAGVTVEGGELTIPPMTSIVLAANK